MINFLTGLSATALIIGLSLLGLTFGSAVANDHAAHEHALFYPALLCAMIGVINMGPFLLSKPWAVQDESS
tara:strand:+ start:291 stop:503 length:213 start_codon:yes stop_codon:yes gene_type:complete